MRRVSITTVDNPWDPFEQFKEWLAYDIRHGYNTVGLLARLTFSSDELSDADIQAAVERAIDAIVEVNPMGVHTKLVREFEDN